MSVWYIFVGVLGPMVVLMVGMMVAQHRGHFRSPEANRSEPDFGRRHPMLVSVAAVFGVGLVSGAFIGRSGKILLSALLGGVIGGVLFLLVASILAFIVTVVQLIKPRSRESFAPRFMRNLTRAFELLVQGWS